MRRESERGEVGGGRVRGRSSERPKMHGGKLYFVGEMPKYISNIVVKD